MALPFTFHSNTSGPFMQKEKIIVWHVSHFQKNKHVLTFTVFCLLPSFPKLHVLYQKQNRFVQNMTDIFVDTKI